MVYDDFNKLNKKVISLKALISGISVLFLFNKSAYPVVYVVPPDIDMYMHQTNDTYKLLIDNLCGAGNGGQGIIKDCFSSLTAYLNSASSYSFIPLANPNINNLSTTIGNANITSSTITNSLMTSSTITNSLMTSSTVASSTITFSSITNSTMGSTTYCFPIGNSSTCFTIEDYTTMQYQQILIVADYNNGALSSASSGTVWMPSCTYHTANQSISAQFVAFAPTSCSYDFSNPGSPNNVVGGTANCPAGDSASVCYTISASCFFSSTISSQTTGTFYTNLPVLSFCGTWSET